MARRTRRATPTHQQRLAPLTIPGPACQGPLWSMYVPHRTVTTLTGVHRLPLRIRRCVNPACSRDHRPERPDQEGAWALPHGEFGLDLIALVGSVRCAEDRRVGEIHQQLLTRGVPLAPRTVHYLIARYEARGTLHLADQERLRARLTTHGRGSLALAGLQPDPGHDVRWVIRDCRSSEGRLARSLVSATQGALVALRRDVKRDLPLPVTGIISDGQETMRTAVEAVFPSVAHQLCQFHSLRAATKAVSEADRHATQELQKRVRGMRPLERALEDRTDDEATALRGAWLAVRSAITDDGRPPLSTPGGRRHDRRQSIVTAIDRIAEKGGVLSP